MHPLISFFKKEYDSIIEYSEIIGKNIIMCSYSDTSLFWVHHLTSDKVFACITDKWLVFYSKKFDVYFFYYLEHEFGNGQLLENTFTNEIHNVTNNNKSVHFILSNVSDKKIQFFENLKLSNFKYSLLNYNSEIFYESDQSKDIHKCKNLAYLFSCTNMLSVDKNNKVINGNWQYENSDKFILDHNYSFTYFYTKFGYCYFQKGEQGFEVSNRKNKVFIYSKGGNKDSTHPRSKIILKAIETGKILNKAYSDDDWFWYFANYNNYHIPFTSDYNLCKFNLVIETQSLVNFKSDKSLINENKFFSEKTLKALMVSTPAYVLLQYDVYHSLKNYGFYFLNEEFGEYEMEHPEYFTDNYRRFCEFLNNASESDMDSLFNKAYEKSKYNKIKLEEYIYSDKVKELNLLIKEEWQSG